MINDEKYSCVSELGAEILMVITALIIVISVFLLLLTEGSMPITIIISDQYTNLFMSSAYTIFLPLMSYLFSQAKQNDPDGRAQLILIWMVLIEIIRIRSDPIFTWRLRKSAEQFVRLFWVGFLVCSYTSLHGIRLSLLVLCINFGVYEVLKGIMFYIANDSYLIGNNPNLIHNYVERIMLKDDLRTTPMNICDYIVMGEENHEIYVCSNGYALGKKKSSSGGILTIGRVFQLSSSEDELFTSACPYWRDICLSFALAKMLRQRFAKFPVDEARFRKSLDFVLEGIIDYIGSNRDIQTDENDGERNSTERIFSIIQEELKFVSEFLRMKKPKAPRKKAKKARVSYSSIVDLEAETIFFCIKVEVSTLACLPKLIRRIIPRSSPMVICTSTDTKEAILKSLRKSDGRLTNGETSLNNHGMDHLNWACLPNANTTETILVWHIATTLFHNHKPSPHQNIDPHQEPASQQNNNPFKEQEVALELSSYCHYLVKCLPDLLPDKVVWIEDMYETVRNEILDIALFFDQKPTLEMKFKGFTLSCFTKNIKPTKEYRCNYALHAMWPESSVVGKGAMLAKDLIKCAEDDEARVWMMLADFWAEMMLFIAPSDNVDGHQKNLGREEFITQLWALLTHAGIITRPKSTKHQDSNV